ncbi:MAG: recombinase family protein [Candidatus Limnocylindrales bacterium]
MSTRYPDWTATDVRPEDPCWGVYARLSLAGDEDETGVDRQVADAINEARRRGAKRVRIYADDGFSAFKRRVVRPRFEDLLTDLADDRLPGGVVAWRAERLARQPRDAERLLDALRADEDDPRTNAYTIADGVDTSTEAGKFVFRQLVQFGRWESKAIGQRVARAARARAEQGRFHGGPPAFGHRDGTAWREVEPREADAIRGAAERILAGDGVRSILRDWTAQGLLTRTGKPWQHAAWRNMILSPRMAGLRVSHGVESSGVDPEGRPWIAQILDEETWRALKRVLEDPARRRQNPGGQAKHLLTSVLRCGACFGPLRAKGHAGHKNGRGYWTYGCIKDWYHPTACGKVWIKGVLTDQYIEGVVLAALSDRSVVAALTRGMSAQADGPDGDEEGELHAALLEVRERVLAAEVAWMRGPAVLEAEFGISPEGYRRWRAGAIAERDELEKRVARLTRGRAVVRAVADPERFWAEATLETKRDVIRAVCPDIVVRQAASLPEFPQRWDRRRIAITFAG